MGQVVRVEDPASDVDAWRVLDAFTHCLVVIDAAGLVRHTNAAMRRLDADAGRFVPGADFLAGCAAQFDEGAGELRVALSDVLSGLCQRQELELSYRAPSGRRWMTMVLTPCEVGGARGALADASDVTYRTEAEAAVRESEARYRTLVDGSPDIVFITDEASRMIYANRALEEQTGYTVADFQMPQRENRLLHPDDRERVAHVIAEFLASGSHHSERIENRFITKTGEVLWYSSVISRTDYQGRPALQFMVHNVTAEQRTLDESAARRREAERALRVRDQFLSAAAHELKTPVTTLMAYAQWLGASLERGQTIAPARAQKALAAIDRQSRALDRIVSQLLDIGHLETDQLVLRRAPADVAALVRQRAERSKAPIVVQAPPRVVAYVDPLRLVQVVDNLIDNALRFAPRGSQVDVSVVELEGAVEIAVTDRGEGIAPEIRQQLFERAAPDGAGGHRRGIGVGLWTSRRLVELHGGTLRLESPVGGGARFVVRIPREAR